MKEAIAIELYDAGTYIIGEADNDRGVFCGYTHPGNFQVSERGLRTLLEAIGIAPMDIPHRYKPARREYGDVCEGIGIVREVQFYDDHHPKGFELVKLEAEVIGPKLLDIRIHEQWPDSEACVREITYSGRFSVEWVAK